MRNVNSFIRHLLSVSAIALAVVPTVTHAQDIAGVTLLPIDGKPRIGVILVNPTDATLWANVSIEEAERIQCGGGKTQVPANDRMMAICPISEIVAKRDYPITVTFLNNEEPPATIGTRKTKGRFRKQDVEWLNAQIQQAPDP